MSKRRTKDWQKKLWHGMFSLAVAALFLAGCGGSSSTTSSSGSSGGTTVSGTMAVPAKQSAKKKLFASTRHLGHGAHLNTSARLRRGKAISLSYARREKKFATTSGNLEALDGAVVSAFDATSGKALATGLTDSTGKYSLTIPDGEEKGILIVGTKVVSGDVKTVKVAVDQVTKGQENSLKQADPSTTLAAENYVDEVKKAVAAGKSEEDVDFDAIDAKYEQMDDDAVDKLYDDLDQAWDDYATDVENLGTGEDLDFAVFGNNETDPDFDSVEQMFDLIDAGDAAFEAKMAELLGTDWQTKLDQLEQLRSAAFTKLDETIASLESQSLPNDDYYAYLSDELAKQGITCSATTLKTNLDLSEQKLRTIIDDPNATQNQIDAAYERFYAEEDLINFCFDIATDGSKTDAFYDEIVTFLDGGGSFPQMKVRSKSVADLDPITRLWNFEARYSFEKSASLVSVTPSTAEVDFLEELETFGFVDENGNDIQDSGEPAHDQTAIDDACLTAAGSEPTIPADTATDADWATYFSDWDAWEEACRNASDQEANAQIVTILTAKGVSWADQVQTIIDKWDAILSAADSAWAAYETAWDSYWANVGTSYDAAYAQLDTDIQAAFAAVGLTDQEVENAYMQAEAAYWDAVASQNLDQTLYDFALLEDIGNIYGDPHAQDRFPEALAQALADLGGDTVEQNNVKKAAADLVEGAITDDAFVAALKASMKKTLIDTLSKTGVDKQTASSKVDGLIQTIDKAFDTMDQSLASAASDDDFNTAWMTFSDTVTTEATSVGLSSTDAANLITFLDIASSGSDVALAKGRARSKTRS